MPVAVIDFFSGCGGTSLGMQDAGMSIVAGIDNDHDSALTFRRNFPEAQFVERDIRAVSVAEIKKLVPSDQPLLLCGCAPCQPFSKQNRLRREDDPRRRLLGEFERFVIGLLPEFIVIENVPGLQKIGDGAFYDLVRRFELAGYFVSWQILRALDFGVPQTRKRLVLVGARSARLEIPEATHGGSRIPVATVREFIADLPPLGAGETDGADADHSTMDLSKLNLLRISCTPEGRGRESWPSELTLDCHRGHVGHSDVYGRLAWDKPAAAITTRCLSYSNGRFGHPSQNRAISLREAACLQTFPRSFRFEGSLLSRGRQVGNAVPPLMAKVIGDAIVCAAKGIVS